jgi:hypothetical protein
METRARAGAGRLTGCLPPRKTVQARPIVKGGPPWTPCFRSICRFFFSFNPDPEKVSAYECGFNAFDDARMKFDVRFYLVAILFIIFDLEVAFLFPWAVGLRHVDGSASGR